MKRDTFTSAASTGDNLNRRTTITARVTQTIDEGTHVRYIVEPIHQKDIKALGKSNYYHQILVNNHTPELEQDYHTLREGDIVLIYVPHRPGGYKRHMVGTLAKVRHSKTERTLESAVNEAIDLRD